MVIFLVPLMTICRDDCLQIWNSALKSSPLLSSLFIFSLAEREIVPSVGVISLRSAFGKTNRWSKFQLVATFDSFKYVTFIGNRQ